MDKKTRVKNPGYRLLILGACLAAISVAAAPASAKPAPYHYALTAADKALVQQAAAYLQGLRSAKGRFSQTDARGQVTAGALYLQRPGKARFQYDPPTNLLVVSDGINVSVYDQRLKSFDQYPLKQTPLALLLAGKVGLGDRAAIGAVNRTPDGFTVLARDPAHEAEGGLSLKFAAKPLALKGWTVIDAQGHHTDVRLISLEKAGTLDPGLFMLKDPRSKAFKP